MNVTENSYVKRIFVLFSGNVFAQVIPFILAPIITRIYTPEQMGVQGNFIALVTLLGVVANGRYELSVVLPKDDKKAFNLLILSVKITLLIVFLSASLLFFKEDIAGYYNTTLLSPFLIYVPFGVLLFSLHNIFIQWLVRKEFYRKISLVKIVLSVVTNLSLIYLGWLHYGVDGLIGGFLLGFLISVLLLFFYISKTIKTKWYNANLEKEMMRKYKDFPLINSLHAFSDLLFSEFIILSILTHQFGVVTAGIYVIMIKYLKAPSRFISNAIGQVFYKESSVLKAQGKAMYPIMKKSIQLSLWVAVPMLIIVLLAGESLFAWYLGEEWREVGVFAKIMILPIFLNFLTSPISSLPLVFQQQKKSLLVNLSGMTISAGLFAIGAVYFDNIYTALAMFAFAQSTLILYLLYWYATLSKNYSTYE